MCTEILEKNVQYIREVGFDIFEDELRNENVNHFIANSTADLEYEISDDDIIFKFSLDADIRYIPNDDEKGKFKKDPTGIINQARIGILTKENTFFEYMVSLEETNHVFLIGVYKLTLDTLKPDYTFYKQDDNPKIRKFKTLDHLFIDFNEIGETIRLYGHSYCGNKQLSELNKELFKRL